MPGWVTPVATLVASFVGVVLAFGLQAWRVSRHTRHERVAAVNRAMMTLLLHGRIVSNFKVSMLDDYDKADALRGVKVSASLPYDLDRYRYDFTSLGFLTAFNEREAVLELYEEEDLFLETLKSINDRSSLIYNEVDPALLKAGLADGGEHDGPRFPKALGSALFNALERKTDAMVEGVQTALEKMGNATAHFSSVVHERYPKEAIMYVDIQHIEPDAP